MSVEDDLASDRMEVLLSNHAYQEGDHVQLLVDIPTHCCVLRAGDILRVTLKSRPHGHVHVTPLDRVLYLVVAYENVVPLDWKK